MSEEFYPFWKETGDGEREKRLSDKLIKDLVQTKNVNGAHDMLIQLHLAMFDSAVHTPSNHEAAKAMDTTALWNGTREDIIGLTSDDTMTPGIGQAGFPHIYRKYDAGYFAYTLQVILIPQSLDRILI
jgi:metallopeptidase MepB